MSKITAPKKAEATLAYTYQNARYINITSRCPTACKFCIKFSWDYMYRGSDLKLSSEPRIGKVLEAAGTDLSGFDEIVFCGYGESTYRLVEMEALSLAFRRRGARKIRLNTIGLGNLIHRRNIVPDLAGFLDAVSVSLNTLDPDQYVKIHHPLPQFRLKAFESACQFSRLAAASIPETTITAVQMPGVDTDRVRKFAHFIGASFRLRPHLEEYEDH